MKTKTKSKTKAEPKAKKRRTGRHRLPEDERRTEVMTLKLSKGERALVFEAARSAGYAPYAWGRRSIVHAAKVTLGKVTAPVPEK